MLPVAIIPNCAATRFISFELDGNGPATLSPPNPDIWSGIPQALPAQHGRQVNLDTLTRQQVAQWRTGETLLLSGKLLTARDAAHKRMRSEEHTSELQSLMRISYAVFCLKKKK